MNLRSFLLILLGLTLAFSLPAFAEQPGTEVKHVNYEKKEVTLELYRRKQGERQVVVYKIDPGCTITLDGQNVPLRRIHRGQHVTGMTEGDTNVLVALSVQN